MLNTPEGTLVALDGATGELVLAPDDDVLTRFRYRATELAKAARAAQQQAGSAARTRDGVHILVGANIGSVADAHLATSAGADLAGLVRTDFLFLGRDAAPDVDEQEAIYRDLAQALDGRPLTLRTLDVGGDKPLRRRRRTGHPAARRARSRRTERGPRAVSALKQAVRALDRGHAATTVGLALDADSPQQVRTLVEGRPAP